MSSKSKLITAIVLLAVGAGLVPTGLVTNDYLENRVSDGVPEALIRIRDDGIEGLSTELPVLATPDVLKGIYDTANEELEEFIIYENTAEFLRQAKYVFVYEAYGFYYSWWYLISSAVAARMMNITIAYVGQEAFFNDNSTLVWGALPGIATLAGPNMSYGFHSQNVIMNYGMVDAYIPDVPGWAVDSMGAGIGQFNSRFEYINWSALPDYTLDTLNGDYFTDIAHCAALYTYTSYYIYGGAAGWFTTAYPGGNFTLATTPSVGFYEQWANGTYIPDGIDLHEFFGYNWVNFGSPGLKGLEAGLAATPTNLTLAQSSALWAEWDNNSFCHNDGFEYWMDAAADALEGDPSKAVYLMTYFGLNQAQFNMVASWLYNYMTTITPVWMQNSVVGPGVNIETTAKFLFYEHWANGTILGGSELPGGFLNELSPTLAGTPYFEIGLPVASNLTLAKTMALWSLTSDKTFFFSDSFQSLWLPAIQGDATSVGLIMAEFGLSLAEATLVLGWLGALIGLDPSTGRISEILAAEQGVSFATIILLAVYEQWANGTINEEEVIPDGLLSRRDPPIYGPPYFEIGIEYAAGITRPQVFALWNEASDYSLVTASGINKWYGAAAGNTLYNQLKTQNGLTDLQMGAILIWLPDFRDVTVNKLAKDDLGLPMEPYALGDTLALSLGIGGGALAALGVILLILSRRT